MLILWARLSIKKLYLVRNPKSWGVNNSKFCSTPKPETICVVSIFGARVSFSANWKCAILAAGIFSKEDIGKQRFSYSSGANDDDVRQWLVFWIFICT
jgi:hypothetical protein